MKLNFLKLKTNAVLKKSKAFRSNLPYKQARTVGVLFSVEDKQKHFVIKEFIKKLEQDEKVVQVLEYMPAKHENYEFKFDFFTEKELSFWGNITSSSANQFADAPFDFLFYIDLEPNVFVLNVLARSKAKCRVGKHFDGGEQYLELMIESAGGIQALIDSMYKYASQLK
ncbi:DUF6913 domain-containing protein [Parachryseolinea silvisoli]|jgi:hypothetical protein|uniref:DUF6913 domain-containing protein n=1 Tax=Parachryseolinea silvisoli TaxID=2873601 RepID=UPI002265EE43|nr:hypothetical protein [Parachryseolinea silvisoli]MCD9017804.1 hypothetical protein [Parachryseolinea silvisoli]